MGQETLPPEFRDESIPLEAAAPTALTPQPGQATVSEQYFRAPAAKTTLINPFELYTDEELKQLPEEDLQKHLKHLTIFEQANDALENTDTSKWSEDLKNEVKYDLNRSKIPDILINEQQHDDFTLIDRGIAKGLSSEADPTSLAYLQNKHPTLDILESDGRILARKKGDKDFRPLDADFDITEAWRDPKKFFKEFGSDFAEIVPDVITGMTEMAAATAGMGVGGFGAAYGSAAFMAGAMDAAKQIALEHILSQQKVNRPLDMKQMMLTGVASPILMFLTGPNFASSAISKYAGKVADKFLKKTIPNYGLATKDAIPVHRFNLSTGKREINPKYKEFMDYYPTAANPKEATQLLKSQQEEIIANDLKSAARNIGGIPKAYNLLVKDLPTKVAELGTSTPSSVFRHYIRNLDEMDNLDLLGPVYSTKVVNNLYNDIDNEMSDVSKRYIGRLDQATKNGVKIDTNNFYNFLQNKRGEALKGPQNEVAIARQNYLDNVQTRYFELFDPFTRKRVEQVIPKKDGTNYILPERVSKTMNPLELNNFKQQFNKDAQWGVDLKKIPDVAERESVMLARDLYKYTNELLDSNVGGIGRVRDEYDRKINFKFAVEDLFKRSEAKQGNFEFDQKAFEKLSQEDSAGMVAFMKRITQFDNQLGLKGREKYTHKIDNIRAHSYLGKNAEYTRAGKNNLSTARTVGYGASAIKGREANTRSEGIAQYLVGTLATALSWTPKNASAFLSGGKKIENVVSEVVKQVSLRNRYPTNMTPAQQTILQSTVPKLMQYVLDTKKELPREQITDELAPGGMTPAHPKNPSMNPSLEYTEDTLGSDNNQENVNY